jgi:hypothetical protein
MAVARFEKIYESRKNWYNLIILICHCSVTHASNNANKRLCVKNSTILTNLFNRIEWEVKKVDAKRSREE